MIHEDLPEVKQYLTDHPSAQISALWKISRIKLSLGHDLNSEVTDGSAVWSNISSESRIREPYRHQAAGA